MRTGIICLATLLGFLAFALHAAGAEKLKDGIMDKYNPLTPEEEAVIVGKGTEYPGTGKYLHHRADGIYVCKRCGAPLYRSEHKFDSGCGWPAFDDEIPGAVRRETDADGRRTEILCSACGGHLGHVFAGERLTPKNLRHCVNSVSLRFIPGTTGQTAKAYFAAGCFWGVEYWFKKMPGVVKTTVGYMGGETENPSYRDVCSGETGHAEVLEVEYDPERVGYEELARRFFEIHDFTQIDRQGPDIGDQYRSEAFVVNPEQEAAVGALLAELIGKGYAPATKVTPAGVFWPAEDYHRDYYGKNGQTPYCHAPRPVF